MKNFIQNLIKLVPPSTRNSSFLDSDHLNMKYGTPILLPQDYLDFLNCYSVGSFTENGYASWPILDLITDRGVSVTTEYFLLAKEKSTFAPEIIPSVYPTIPGLLPWGASNQGYTFYWWVNGDPNLWSVIADRRDQAFHFQLSMTEFLFQMFSDQLHELYPKGFISNLQIGYITWDEYYGAK